MIRFRFRQLIRVVLLGLTISLPAVARADIISGSDADSPASDSPPADSSSDTSSNDPASSDSNSSDSSSDPQSDSAISDLAYFEAIEVLIDPSDAPSLLDDWVADSSGYNLENLDSGDLDPSSGDTSFVVSDDMSMPDCIVVPTPEPGSLAVWTLAAFGIAGCRRMRSQRPSRA